MRAGRYAGGSVCARENTGKPSAVNAGEKGAADLKSQFEIELFNSLMPYIKDDCFGDAKMRITLTCGKYDITKAETDLIPYEGDINEMIIRRFLMAKIASGRSPRTVKYYKESVSKTLEEIGKPYNQITADDIRFYIAKRTQNDHISKVTVNNERRCLSAFYTWLQKEEILLKNPMSKVDFVKVNKKTKKAFTQMELELIRNACRNERETAMVEFLISTWARVSEMAQVKLSELVDGKVIVHGKGDKEREVYLSPKAILAIKLYIEKRSDHNPYLFPRCKYAGDIKTMTKSFRRKEQGRWWTQAEFVGEGHADMGTIETVIRNIGKRAGVENTHPHRFRRTGATMALRAGMPLLTVSKILGHESIGTTQIYLDITDKELLEAHEKYAR